VGIVCNHCHRVRSYSWDKTAPDYDPTEPTVLPDKWSAVFAGWLRCDEKTCKNPLALFSLASIPHQEDKKRKQRARWKWGTDLFCPNGHRIRQQEPGSGV
jgi:hypothetical protein